MIGQQFRGFVIRHKIAEGGMGAVYLAEHAALPQIRKVIKVLLPRFAAHPELRSRFVREAEAASRLSHVNIQGIDDFGMSENGQLWYMMGFLEGQRLDEFLRARGGRISEAHALPIVIQLCRALDHAHRAGIVHRDLKPENVFLCAGSVKLLDFGIAKIMGESDGARTQAGSTIGTPIYMAVEQHGSADKVTPSSDIYSLAIMMCEMVTGKLPWGRHDQAVLYYLQRTTPPNLEGLSPKWRRLTASALAFSPINRPQSARAFLDALAIDNETLTLTCNTASCSGEITPPPTLTVRRPPIAIILALLVCAAAFAFMLVMVWVTITQ